MDDFRTECWLAGYSLTHLESAGNVMLIVKYQGREAIGVGAGISEALADVRADINRRF